MPYPCEMQPMIVTPKTGDVTRGFDYKNNCHPTEQGVINFEIFVIVRIFCISIPVGWHKLLEKFVPTSPVNSGMHIISTERDPHFHSVGIPCRIMASGVPCIDPLVSVMASVSSWTHAWLKNRELINSNEVTAKIQIGYRIDATQVPCFVVPFLWLVRIHPFNSCLRHRHWQNCMIVSLLPKLVGRVWFNEWHELLNRNWFCRIRFMK